MAGDDRIAVSLPTLINGVSRQAPGFRLISQADEQINCLSSVVDGVSKRPPTELVRVIANSPLRGVFAHTINRDSNERYLALFTGDTLKVFDLMKGGTECRVNFPKGKAYIRAGNPGQALRAVTIADYTFIANREITVRMDETAPVDVERNEALAYVKTGVSNTDYEVMVDGTWFKYSTPMITTSQESGTGWAKSNQTGENPSTTKIAGELAKLIAAGKPAFTVDANGPSLRVRRANNAEFSFSVRDSFGDQALVGVKREIEKWQDLPPKAWDGFRVHVTGENNDADGAFYLEYESRGSTQTGLWKECPGWNQRNRIAAATMPHKLVREADGTFTFSPAAWRNREVGDDGTAPIPTFVGTHAEDVFFYRNRFGVLCDENVCLSEPLALSDDGSIQWWPDSGTSVLATDPIDAPVTSNKVSLLRHAVVYGENLMLFADQAQFQMGSGNSPTLAPDTVQVDPVAEYHCSGDAKPVNAGQSVYFITEAGGMGGSTKFSAVREYTISPDAVKPETPEITSHIPGYIPRGVTGMEVMVNDQTLFLLSGETPATLYVYRYFWVGQEKVQSSWSKWDFGSSARIVALSAIQSTLFLVVERDGGVALEKLDMQSQGETEEIGYEIHLDRKVGIRGTYGGGKTVWTLPYPPLAGGGLIAVFGPGSGEHPAGQAIAVRNGFEFPGGNKVALEGRHDGSLVIFAFPYRMLYRFSPQLLRESKDPGAAALAGGRLQLLRFLVNYSESGTFEARVRSEGRREVVKAHGDKLGSVSLVLDRPCIDSGIFSFPVRARADRVEVELVSESHFPVCFQSAEWEGTYNTDARRV